MEIIHSEIKKALLVTFEEIVTYYGGCIGAIPEKKGYMITGILMGDHFLDIKRKQVYETLFPDEDGLVPFVPEIGVSYVYAIDDYSFKSKWEEKELLKEAQEMLDIYEEKENVVSFGKEKIKYRYKQSYRIKK